jgi:hypothetical protein
MNNYTSVIASGRFDFYAYGRLGELNTFYVDAQNGIDAASYTGAAIMPFRTVAYAATRVTAAGSVIHARAGIYNEASQISLSRGVSLRGDGIGQTVIRSTFAANDTGSIAVTSPVADPVSGNQQIFNLTLDGVALTARVGIVSGYRNNVRVHNIEMVNFNRGGIMFISDDAFPNPPTVLYATGNGVHDCIITNCGFYNASYAALWFNGQRGFININNKFDNTARAAGSNAWATVKCNWNEGYIFEGCELRRNNHELGNWNFFLENWNYEGGCIIRNNDFYGLATIDLGGNNNDRKNGYLYGLRAYKNNFINAANGNYTNGGFNKLNQAFTIEGQGHQYLQVFDNKIQRYGIGIAIQTSNLAIDYYLHHIRIYNNELSNIGFNDHNFSYGIQVLAETPAGGHSNTFDFIDIVNNTVTANAALVTYRGIGVFCNGVANYWNVSNNIVANFDDRAIFFDEHAADGLAMTGLRATNNDLFNNGTDTAALDAAVVATDCDVTTSNIVDDPLFISASDLHLQAATPCKYAALPVPYIEYDGDGIIIETQPTIGCYQLN